MSTEKRLPLPARGRPEEAACYDPAVPVGVHTSIIIAAEERTGSSLLAQALWLTGRAGLPAEYLQGIKLIAFRRRWGLPEPSLRGRFRYTRMTLGRRWPPDFGQRYRSRSVPPFVRALASRRSTPNGVFGLKTMWGDYKRLVVEHGIDPTTLWDRPVWIRLRRRDRLRQAVSGVRSSATRRYTSSHPRLASEPAYDRDRIDLRLRAYAADRAGWDDYLTAHAAPHLELWYEDLADDLAGALAAIFDTAGITPPSTWPAAPLEPLADASTEDWVARYQAGH